MCIWMINMGKERYRKYVCVCVCAREHTSVIIRAYGGDARFGMHMLCIVSVMTSNLLFAFSAPNQIK